MMTQQKILPKTGGGRSVRQSPPLGLERAQKRRRDSMKVYLLRHGETVYNRESRYQGSRDIPLSEEGRAKLHRADLAPEVVYVSPLTRAQETAKILFPEAKLITIPDLREMDFGVFEGRSAKEMADDPTYRAWTQGNCMGQIPQGESMEGFSHRTCAVLGGLIRKALDEGKKELVVVAHGGTQMVAMAKFVRPEKPYFQWLGPNGGGYLLDTAPWEDSETLDLIGQVNYG
jgi:alpha-ribazole phosphatase